LAGVTVVVVLRSAVERERSFHGHMEDVEALGSRLQLRYVALILPVLRGEGLYIRRKKIDRTR
jgi:hypothetical protein